MVIVALFLNLLHQMSGVFISLYGLAVGMTLTQIGVVRAAYAGCNAVTRPISGHVVNKFGHRGLSYAGIPLQSAILMLIPLFTGFGPILAIYVLSGLMRAIVIVANAVGLVQDVDENKVQRGLASGIYNAAGDLGNILGSLHRWIDCPGHQHQRGVCDRIPRARRFCSFGDLGVKLAHAALSMPYQV